jgi:hypothetical protein
LSTLSIEAATYLRDGGYPLLELKLGGGAAYLEAEHRPQLLEAGLVHLGGGDWEDLVPEVPFSAPGVTPTTLRGFTNDPAIVSLYRRFLADLADGSFRPGPVELGASAA